MSPFPAAALSLPPGALLGFTDADGEFPERAPVYPVMWSVMGNAPAPLGERWAAERGEMLGTWHTNLETRPAPQWCRAAATALCVVLVLITLQAIGLGVSGLFAQLAQFEMENSGIETAPSRAREVGRIEQHLYTSFRYASGNPWTLEQLGTLNLARMRASRVPREAVALTRDARIRFRQALSQRPTSPFLWANLALAKLYLDEFDAEFNAALRHADELGPWEPIVQQVVVFAGLAAWQQLEPGVQQALVRTLERGALRNAEKMVQIVKSYRRFDLICGSSQYNSIIGRECAEKPLKFPAWPRQEPRKRS